MTPSGIYQVVHDRARAAGLPAMHPHQLRHAFATSWLAEGGNENELMLVAGWKSRIISIATPGPRPWSGLERAMPACHQGPAMTSVIGDEALLPSQHDAELEPGASA
jgi:hypothetical protein